ncbi:MAG: formate/nitrite transporter family protein [Cyclobacteriaceae bacterium]|nr:formate/nitrite transporter family protein [Cyclobacteriaceae bacterium]
MKSALHRNRKKDSQDKKDSPKEVKQILNEQIETGLGQFKRPRTGLFISSFAAGLEIGFSILFMGVIFTLFSDVHDANTLKMYLSLGYPIGFIFVIIGRSELFTEHTALALLPVLNRLVGIRELFVLWGLIYLGNLIGGYFFSFLISEIGPSVGFIETKAFYHLAHEMVDYDWNIILLSAILAGWMMGLLGWLVTSSQETISRIVVIILVTFIIGLTGLHHCIVGSIEVFCGLITSPDITVMDYLKFQFWATVGNIIGGVFFVSILKYSHVRLK